MKKVSKKQWVSFMAPKIYKFGEMLTTDAVTIANSAYEMYADNNRSYHGVYHPQHILEFAQEHNIELTNEQTVAIVFHDVIYKIGSSKNEVCSALYAEAVLSPFITNPAHGRSLNKIKNHILDTKQHFNKVAHLSEPDSDLVLDLDLCNMMLSYSEFSKWNEALESELIDIPLEKRLEFLKDFLNKKKILHSDLFADKEEIVRENISKLIEEKENQTSIE